MTKIAVVRLLMCSLPLGGMFVLSAQAADLSAPRGSAPAVVADPGPYDLNVTYAGEVWQNSGGLKNGTDYLYGLDASLNINTEKLLGVQDSKFYIEGFYVGGKSLDFNYTGALQAPSAVDAYTSMNTLKLYQAYYEQKFGATDVLIGKYDVQTQFATTRPMDLFGNKAQAMPLSFLVAGLATGLNGASSYPDTSVGLRIKQTLNDQWSVKVGLLDGYSDLPNSRTGILISSDKGALGVGEIDYTPWANTKIMAGVWGETGKLTKLGQFSPTFMPITTWGEVGEYVGGATRVYTIEGNRGIDVFANAGFTPGPASLISKSYDAGVTVTGPLAFRPTDKLGFAIALEQNSSGYKALQMLAGNSIASYETAYELTYRAKITDWLVLQPEVDYIVHPSGGQAPGLGLLKNAFVFGLHFELHKEFF